MTTEDTNVQKIIDKFDKQQSPEVIDIMNDIYELLVVEFHAHPHTEDSAITIQHDDLMKVSTLELDFHMHKFFGKKYKKMTWERNNTSLTVIRKPTSVTDWLMNIFNFFGKEENAILLVPVIVILLLCVTLIIVFVLISSIFTAARAN